MTDRFLLWIRSCGLEILFATAVTFVVMLTLELTIGPLSGFWWSLFFMVMVLVAIAITQWATERAADRKQTNG